MSLHDEATDIYKRLRSRFREKGDKLDLEAMNLIEKAMKRVPKRTRKLIDKSKAQASSEEEIRKFLAEEYKWQSEDHTLTAAYLWMHWTENGWRNGNRPMRDWKLTVRKWVSCGYIPAGRRGFAKKSAKRATKPEDHHDGF